MENITTLPDTIIFYRSFYKAIRNFQPMEQLELYQAIFKLAFENINTKFPEGSMQESIYEMASPMVLANIRNQANGKKGGRPRNPQPQPQPQQEIEPETPEEQPEVFYTGLGKDVEDFITDYKAHKSADFEPTPQEKEKISIILKDLGSYKKDYWCKIFDTTKYGFDINGEAVPCSLTKILLEHNKIFRGELKFKPNKEVAEQKRKAREKAKQERLDEYNKISKEELAERQQAYTSIDSPESAVKYLNDYIYGGVLLKQCATDYKQLKHDYPNIAVNKEGFYYVES